MCHLDNFCGSQDRRNDGKLECLGWFDFVWDSLVKTTPNHSKQNQTIPNHTP